MMTISLFPNTQIVLSKDDIAFLKKKRNQLGGGRLHL